MTYDYKCQNCKRTTTRQHKQIMVLCGCGYEMALIKSSCGKTTLKNEHKRGFKKMRTYFIELEKGKEKQEVIPVGLAFSYAVLESIKATTDEELNEEEFFTFLDQQSIEIEDNLKEMWEDWKEEQEE